MRTAYGSTEPWGAGPVRKAKPGQAKSMESIASTLCKGKTDALRRSRVASKMTPGSHSANSQSVSHDAF